jgi:hypothetical protein
MIKKKYFRLKYWRKILAFFSQTTASFCKNVIITLVFEKNAIFAENWQTSPKIEIFTSTPAHVFRYTTYVNRSSLLKGHNIKYIIYITCITYLN